MKLSKSGYNLCAKMVEELSTCGYVYSSIIEGCYDYCLYRYGMPVPEESKEQICIQVLGILQCNDEH